MNSALFGAAYALFCGLAALGFGSAFARLTGARLAPGERGVAGLFSFTILAGIVHFFAPLNSAYRYTALIGGIMLLACFGRGLLRNARMAVTLCFLLSLGYFALSAEWSRPTYDQGLYYYQILRWNRELPLVRGLASLHGRLVLSPGYYLAASIVPARLAWVPNALAGAFLVSACFGRALRIKETTRFDINRVFVTSVAILLVLTNEFGAFLPDILVRALILYWVSLAIEHLTEADPERLRSNATMLIVVATFAFVTKLSAAPLLPLSGVLLMVRKKASWRTIGPAAAICGIALCSWVLRNVFTSGCLVYPVSATCLWNLRWTATPEQVTWYAVVLKAWARSPDFRYLANATSWRWLPEWFHRNLLPALLLPLLAIALAFLTALRERFRNARYTAWPALPVGGLLCVCLVYWFFTAPDVRFASGYLLSLILLAVSVSASILAPSWRWPELARAVIFIYLPIGILFLLPHSLRAISDIPEAPVYQVAGDDNSTVFVPRQGEFCWDHPLPCTPYPHTDWWARIDWPFRNSAPSAIAAAPPVAWKYIEQEDVAALNPGDAPILQVYRPAR